MLQDAYPGGVGDLGQQWAPLWPISPNVVIPQYQEEDIGQLEGCRISNIAALAHSDCTIHCNIPETINQHDHFRVPQQNRASHVEDRVLRNSPPSTPLALIQRSIILCSLTRPTDRFEARFRSQAADIKMHQLLRRTVPKIGQEGLE
jgi:hypothetical protein